MILDSNINAYMNTKPIKQMQKVLVGFFVDRTAIDTTFCRFFDDETMAKHIAFMECAELNDERKMEFARRYESSYEYKKEKDLFIPNPNLVGDSDE